MKRKQRNKKYPVKYWVLHTMKYNLKTKPMVYRTQKMQKGTIKHTESREGDSLETQIQRLMENKEMPDQSAPLIYTDRNKGVMAAYDIRTDKWDLALEGMDKIEQARNTEREQRRGELRYDTMTNEKQAEFDTKFPKNKHAVAKALANKPKEG